MEAREGVIFCFSLAGAASGNSKLLKQVIWLTIRPRSCNTTVKSFFESRLLC